jgi:hypothetical protein
MSEPKLDEWGHVESVTLPCGAVAGVLPRRGGAMIAVAYDGRADRGYDRVWWYADLATAIGALRDWDRSSDLPRDYIRDCHIDPVGFDDAQQEAD